MYTYSPEQVQQPEWQGAAALDLDPALDPPPLGPGSRASNFSFWWVVSHFDCANSDDGAPGMECAAGMEGYKKQTQCEQECKMNPHCGGVSLHASGKGRKGVEAFFRPANCSATLRSTRPVHGQPSKSSAISLLVLRDHKEPRPPQVGELPAPQCNLFAAEERCMNVSDGYRSESRS